MENKVRAYIFAFLSRIYASEIDTKLLSDIRANEDLLSTIGEGALEYMKNGEASLLLDELNIEYNTLFLMNNHPIESSIQDVKNEILVGLQNPVMQFYFNHGYEINLETSSLHVPDHIAIEFGFMQKLVLQDDKKAQLKFYKEHLLTWIPQFLTGVKEMTENLFYKDMCDFTIDFLLEDYGNLTFEVSEDV
ncbi:MAG: molecular chaperone TorD family protein [Campylobacterota bacterium]|nr:molecular chaperone TorD family protein [Campylobacterota bacterium]